MTTRAPYFRLVSLAVIAMGIAACAEQEAESLDVKSEVTAEETVQDPVIESAENLQEETQPEIESPPDGPFLRTANFYSLVWRGGEALCDGALATLNRPYGGVGEAKGYAQNQASRMLGTDQNVRWREDDEVAGVQYVEAAELDYFNDGVRHKIVRLHSRLSGSDTISLGVMEADDTALTFFSFGHAGANTEELPAQNNLHTHLTYSVVDVVRLGEGHYTLVAPLEDVDPSGRVYLIQWHTKEGRAAPFAADDYYPVVACIFQPADSNELMDG